MMPCIMLSAHLQISTFSSVSKSPLTTKWQIIYVSHINQRCNELRFQHAFVSNFICKIFLSIWWTWAIPDSAPWKLFWHVIPNRHDHPARLKAPNGRKMRAFFELSVHSYNSNFSSIFLNLHWRMWREDKDYWSLWVLLHCSWVPIYYTRKCWVQFIH